MLCAHLIAYAVPFASFKLVEWSCQPPDGILVQADD